jgi:S-DNA-T family DNA segregation ATPase FtsK/SpoIIIE
MGKTEKYAAMQLPMFLGKDASGNPLIADLSRMPHMLIAGTTGSGKSVCMNSILMSFMYTKKPNELKLVLVDPKMVELSQFKDIPHLMCPVVTEMSKAAAILEWAVRKMDERYELLAEAGCRDIAGYNALTWEELKERFAPTNEVEEARIPKKLPYMVFVIDELADLMMTNREVEGAIVRLAQKARAVGMHLILATQRPQANVVTGLIKSNMPSRIAFKVASGMDSRIVMDQKGAELLLGQGDMLFLSPRSSELTRAQGTLVDDKEIRKVVKFLKDIAAPTFERSLMQIRTGASVAGGLSGSEENADGVDTSGGLSHDGLANAQADPLFDKAVEIVLETKLGSVSMLQRRMAIGYTRASRLIDAMGSAGIIGDHKGTVAREVLISPEEWQAMKAQAAADAASGTVGEAPKDVARAVKSGQLLSEPVPTGPKSADDDDL